MTDLVKAYWACAYPVEVAGHGEISFGDPAMIPKAEAEASANWRLSTPSKTAKHAAPAEIETPPAPDGNAAITAESPTTKEST